MAPKRKEMNLSIKFYSFYFINLQDTNINY